VEPQEQEEQEIYLADRERVTVGTTFIFPVVTSNFEQLLLWACV